MDPKKTALSILLGNYYRFARIVFSVYVAELTVLVTVESLAEDMGKAKKSVRRWRKMTALNGSRFREGMRSNLMLVLI